MSYDLYRYTVAKSQKRSKKVEDIEGVSHPNVRTVASRVETLRDIQNIEEPETLDEVTERLDSSIERVLDLPIYVLQHQYCLTGEYLYYVCVYLFILAAKHHGLDGRLTPGNLKGWEIMSAATGAPPNAYYQDTEWYPDLTPKEIKKIGKMAWGMIASYDLPNAFVQKLTADIFKSVLRGTDWGRGITQEYGGLGKVLSLGWIKEMPLVTEFLGQNAENKQPKRQEPVATDNTVSAVVQQPAPKKPRVRPPQVRDDREGTRMLAAHFHPEVYRQFKVLAAVYGLTTDGLLNKAVALLLEHYGEKPAKPLLDKLDKLGLACPSHSPGFEP